MSNYDSTLDVPNEPYVLCAQCGAVRTVGSVRYDELKENYFCDRICFGEWAADNLEVVEEFYYERNIG